MYSVQLEEACAFQNNFPITYHAELHFRQIRDIKCYNFPKNNGNIVLFLDGNGTSSVKIILPFILENVPSKRMLYLSCYMDPMCHPLLFLFN